MSRTIANIIEAGQTDSSSLARENRRRLNTLIGDAPLDQDQLPELNAAIAANTTTNTSLQNQITTEKNRVDLILDGSNVNMDQFSEVETVTTANSNNIATLNQKSADEYVFDSGRSDSYTEDGSAQRPFKSLAKFASDILTSTPRKIRVHIKGDFVLADTITVNHADWDITIIGGKISMSDISKYCFKVTLAAAWKMVGTEINTCLYALRTYTVNKVEVMNCIIENAGSTGVAANHTPTLNGTQLAAVFAAGNELSNGGALRLQCQGDVRVSNNRIKHVLRAIRIQQATSGTVNGNYVENCSDNGIYLRDSSNVKVVGNKVQNPLHNGLLAIGCHTCQFVANTVIKSAGAPLIQFYSHNIDYIGNNCHNCNRLDHNGYSTSCDNLGMVYLAANATQSCDYIAKVIENNFTKHSSSITDDVLHITSSLASYQAQGGGKLFFADNKHDQTMTETLNSWTKEVVEPASGGYTNSQIDGFLANKMDASVTTITAQQASDIQNNNAKYTTTMVDNLLTGKQNLVFSGAPIGAHLIGSVGNLPITNAEYFTLDGIDTNTTIQSQLNGKLSSGTTTITAQQISDIQTNNAKVSYTDASQVATNTSNIAQNTTDIANLSSVSLSSNNTWTGNNTFNNAITAKGGVKLFDNGRFVNLRHSGGGSDYHIKVPGTVGTADQILKINSIGTLGGGDPLATLSWVDMPSGGGAGSGVALVEGIDWTANISSTNYPFPIPWATESGRSHFFFCFNGTPNWTQSVTTNFANQYMRLPDYGTRDVGWHGYFKNFSPSNNIFVYTYSRGNASPGSDPVSGTSTNQKIIIERLNANIPASGSGDYRFDGTSYRLNYLCLVNRSNGVETWIYGRRA